MHNHLKVIKVLLDLHPNAGDVSSVGINIFIMELSMKKLKLLLNYCQVHELNLQMYGANDDTFLILITV